MPDHRVVAIHQPNFFPWLGYFDKLARSDVFVLLDNVQFPKTGGSWLNRVRLAVNGQPQWVSMPVLRAHHGVRNIADVEINNTTPWRLKLLKTLQMNYRRSPHFDEVFPLVAKLVENQTDHLAEYNQSAITTLATALGLTDTELVLGSTLAVEGKSTDLLIAIVQAVGGTAYLCGDGAAGYQMDEKFAAAGLELIYQDFEHPFYPQTTSQEFIPGLSVIDALMNCSFSRTSALVGAMRVGP
jgi:hypothetical protein